MRTVKEYLLSVNRDTLLDTYLHDYPISLLEIIHLKTPVPEAMADLRHRVNEFVEYLIDLEPIRDVDCVFFVYEKYGEGTSRVNTALCSVDEILHRSIPWHYGWVSSDWRGCIACYISEDELTQFHVYHVLSEVIHHSALFGWSEEEVMEELKYIEEALQESEKNAGEDKVNYRPLEAVLKDKGWPVPEKDEAKDALKRAADLAKMEYERYCYIKAAKRVRELLADSGKE